MLIMVDIGPKVYLYSLITNKCEKIPRDIDKLYLTGAVMTKDERFVICFMAFIREKEIQVLDLNTMKFIKSSIECPDNICDVCIHTDEYKEDIVVSGYIHKCAINDEVPYDITRMIKGFVAFEMVYVLCIPELYRINVDQILLNKHEGVW